MIFVAPDCQQQNSHESGGDGSRPVQLVIMPTNSSDMNSQGDHIIDDFDSAIEEFAVSTIESSEIQPLKDSSQLEHTLTD